jgi:hypothetical protein
VSDFETVLERLLLDPAFRAALATDASGALAGYDLTDDERDVLMAELSADLGQSMRMEERTSKAALFGLLGAAAEILSTPTGLSHVDPTDVVPPTARDQPWLQNLHRQAGYVEVAPINVDARAETDFFDALVSETGIPETDGGSKDPAYLTLKWDETPRVDGPVVEPVGGDGPPPPLEHVKPEPEAIPFDPPAPIHEAVPGKPDLGIKMAPADFDPPAPIYDADKPELGIKMAPGDVKLTGPELPKK